MNELNYPAIRAFKRVWAPIAEGFAIAADADRAIDGGEWSGPASANAQLRAYYDYLAPVARRFGMTIQQLESQIQQADYRELECMMKRQRESQRAKQASARRTRGDSQRTNVDMVTELMERGSPAGALIQAFVVTAIEKYAQEWIEAGAATFDSPMMHGRAWIRCAERALEWHKQHYSGRSCS